MALLCTIPTAVTCRQALLADAGGFPSLLLWNCWALQQKVVLAAAWLCWQLVWQHHVQWALVKHPLLPCLLHIRPTAGCHFLPWVAAGAQQSDRGRARGQDQRGGGKLCSCPRHTASRLSYYTDCRSLSRKALMLSERVVDACMSEQWLDVRRKEPDWKEKRCTCGWKLPGVSRPAQGLHLALPPERHTHLCAHETVAETGKREAVTDIVIVRKQLST